MKFVWPLVFVLFTAYTVVVGVGHGYLGFVDVAIRGGWGSQVFLDLVVACFIALGFILKDARRHGLAGWPFAVATVGLGSIGLLAYMSYRGLKQPQD